MDEYAKAVGEHKAYTIMEQEIQDLQKDEDNNDSCLLYTSDAADE